MLIYFVNLLLIIIYSLLINNKKILVLVISIQLFLLLAFRADNLGVDLNNYIKHFNNYGLNYSLIDIIKDIRFLCRPSGNFYAYESCYNIIVWCCREIGLSFHSYLVVHAAICMTCLGIFIYNFSKIPGLSFYLYVTLGCYLFNFGILRQTLGISLLLISVFAIKKMKPMKFILAISLASMFHVSSFAMLPHYWVSKIKINYKILFVFLGICLGLSFFTKLLFESILGPYISWYGGSQYIAKDSIANNMLIFLVIVSIFLLLFTNSKKFYSDRTNKIFFWGFIFFIIFEITRILARLGLSYNMIFLTVLIPNIISCIKSKYLRVIAILSVSLLSFLFYLYTMRSIYWSYIIPYRSFY